MCRINGAVTHVDTESQAVSRISVNLTFSMLTGDVKSFVFCKNSAALCAIEHLHKCELLSVCNCRAMLPLCTFVPLILGAPSCCFFSICFMCQNVFTNIVKALSACVCFRGAGAWLVHSDVNAAARCPATLPPQCHKESVT